MLTRAQRMLAAIFFLRQPLRHFIPVLVLFNGLLLLGGWAFHSLYAAEPLSLGRAIFVTYALVFMEHLLPFPKHWLLQLAYVLLPLAGLVVILNGIVHFGGRVLNRDPSDKEWNVALIETMRDHVIVCGFGKAGFRTAEVLVPLGEQVCVLEKDPMCPNLAWAHHAGVPVVIGSSRQAKIFEQLGAARAKAIILVTDDDLANLEMALDVRGVNPEIRIIIRVWDQELAQNVRESLSIPVALSSTGLAAPLFATAAIDPSVIHAFKLGDRLMVVAHLEVTPGGQIEGLGRGALLDLGDLWVLEAPRNLDGPEGLAEGDTLTIQTDPSLLRRLHEMNRG